MLAPPKRAARRRLLFDTVDTIWHAAGDRSTDFNFYTKRGLLAGVYAATTLYWLDDRSDDAQATAAFLDRRLAEVCLPRSRSCASASTGLNPLRFARRSGGSAPRESAFSAAG